MRKDPEEENSYISVSILFSSLNFYFFCQLDMVLAGGMLLVKSGLRLLRELDGILVIKGLCLKGLLSNA